MRLVHSLLALQATALPLAAYAPPNTALGGAVMATTASTVATQDFIAKDYSHLKGMQGFSDKTLDTHFKLYQGYVKNSNSLLSQMKAIRDAGSYNESPALFDDLKRRFAWEFNGMRLHELYFENLGGKEPLSPDSALYQRLAADFGSYANWEADFRATGKLRGPGWAILQEDTLSKRLVNTWIDEHDVGVMAGANPLLVLDAWEHAYLLDYNIDRGPYIDAFFNNLNWQAVEDRYNKKPER